VEIKLLIFGGAFFILLAERVGMPKEWWRMVYKPVLSTLSFLNKDLFLLIKYQQVSATIMNSNN
jgi:hypothetical protein